MSLLTRVPALAVLALLLIVPSGFGAPDIDRSAVDFKTPAEITWLRNAAGTNEQAVPPALQPERALLRGDLRNLVAGHRREVRSGRHRARARGHLLIH